MEKYPDLKFLRMPGSGFSWNPVRMVRFAAAQVAALRFCRQVVGSFRPAAVVGFGGFTSAPAALAGRLTGIPVALHEANRVPGLAIRVMGRLATRLYLPLGIRVSGVRSTVMRNAGLPVRREIVRKEVAAARESLGLSLNQKVLVILGGSQGASALNAWARAKLEALAYESIQVYCVTGLGKGESGPNLAHGHWTDSGGIRLGEGVKSTRSQRLDHGLRYVSRSDVCDDLCEVHNPGAPLLLREYVS